MANKRDPYKIRRRSYIIGAPEQIAIEKIVGKDIDHLEEHFKKEIAQDDRTQLLLADGYEIEYEEAFTYYKTKLRRAFNKII